MDYSLANTLITVAVSAIVSFATAEIRDRWKERRQKKSETAAMFQLLESIVRRDIDLLFRANSKKEGLITIKQLRELLDSRNQLDAEHSVKLSSLKPEVAALFSAYQSRVDDYRLNLQRYSSSWDVDGNLNPVIKAANDVLVAMELPPEPCQ